MKLQCLNCNHEFEGTISLDELGWHSVCPECESSFDVDVPEGRIIMAFTDPDDDDEDDPYKYFTDDFRGQHIHLYMAFDTPEKFIKKWKEICDKPNGMWYWCMDNDYCFCSGACDPGDIEIFEEHFKRDRFTMKRRWFYGIKGIEVIWHGEWNDPELIWNGQSFNYYDVENPLYDDYCSDEANMNMSFTDYVKENVAEVESLLQSLSDNGMFYKGSEGI